MSLGAPELPSDGDVTSAEMPVELRPVEETGETEILEDEEDVMETDGGGQEDEQVRTEQEDERRDPEILQREEDEREDADFGEFESGNGLASAVDGFESLPAVFDDAIQEDDPDVEGCSLRMRGASRRKTRPCSLPVCELENVIASTCEEPETPRSHYIRLHRLLHGLPSNRSESSKPEDEEEEEEQEEQEEEPDQVEAATPNGPRRSLPRSRSHQRLSELVQILDDQGRAPGAEAQVGGESEGEAELSPVPCCSHMVLGGEGGGGGGASRALKLGGSVFSSQEDDDDMEGLNGILELDTETGQAESTDGDGGERWQGVDDRRVQSPHAVVGNGELAGDGAGGRSE